MHNHENKNRHIAEFIARLKLLRMQFYLLLADTRLRVDYLTVIDYDYNNFQFMKEDYDYVIVFANGITITSRLRLQILCLIAITKLLDYDYNLIALNSLLAC